MLRTSLTALAVALAALLSLAGCGDDDDDDKAARQAATAAVADPARYCTLTRELDADGERFFAALGRDATPKQFEAAERRFIKASQPKLDELRRVAPRQIAGDVQKLLAGMQQRAGLEPAAPVSEAQATAAEERIRAYEKRTCPA
ncbi:MAG TPA: hypothetical protein VNT54_07805 [Solirubrobacteraceae bacterium]|nr:hypothetical protein [Solirubrobacteraceae bacterium]